VDAYSSLPQVTWEEVTGLEASPYEGCYDTRVLMGLWSTKAEVEDLVLKAAWH